MGFGAVFPVWQDENMGHDGENPIIVPPAPQPPAPPKPKLLIVLPDLIHQMVLGDP